MPMIPHFSTASVPEIAEKALERGKIKYPAICFIQSTNTLAWVDINNQLQYVNGNNQITDIRYEGTDLVFYSGDKIFFSYNAAMSPEDADSIVLQIKKDLKLNEYAKTSEVSKLLDDIIGDLGNKNTVIEYINSLSYNSLSDVPIVNLIGTLSSIINISSLSDGIYKIKGQFIIGGNNTTIQSSPNDTFFIVSHNDDSSIAVTQLQGKSIKIYFINSDGSYVSDRYITEKWITEQDFITSANVQNYVREIVTETIIDVIDKTLDERLDLTLDSKFSGIDSTELHKLFQKGE